MMPIAFPVFDINPTAYQGTDTFSESAHFVEDQIGEINKSVRNTFCFGAERDKAMAELMCIRKECCVPNWDGYNALPVEQETCNSALGLVNALPADIPVPSAGAEPDGHLTLEWYNSSSYVVSISVDPAGDLHYAALIGSEKVCGSAPFFGDTIPEIVLDIIRQVTK